MPVVTAPACDDDDEQRSGAAGSARASRNQVRQEPADVWISCDLWRRLDGGRSFRCSFRSIESTFARCQQAGASSQVVRPPVTLIVQRSCWWSAGRLTQSAGGRATCHWQWTSIMTLDRSLQCLFSRCASRTTTFASCAGREETTRTDLVY